MFICSFKVHIVGQPTYIIAYLVYDLAVQMSSGDSGMCQFQTKIGTCKKIQVLVFLRIENISVVLGLFRVLKN